MNENIESILAMLDGFRTNDEITYSAYSMLHDEISLLDDLLKGQEPAEPKKARWIRLEGMAPPEHHGHKICSACECMTPYDPLHVGREILSPYCPGCGAKMAESR